MENQSEFAKRVGYAKLPSQMAQTEPASGEVLNQFQLFRTPPGLWVFYPDKSWGTEILISQYVKPEYILDASWDGSIFRGISIFLFTPR